MKSNQSMFLRAGTSVVLGIGLVLTGVALAQAGSCKADLERFCPDAKPGGGQIAACLKQNMAQLSPSCKERISEMKTLLKEVDRACEEDIQVLCGGVQRGGGRIAACLKQHSDQVSQGCKARIAEARAGK